MSRVTINSNLASLNAQRRLAITSKELNSTFERLSSGLRITRAGDDAAGLSVSELLNVDQRVYAQGVRNLNDGISALSIAGAALGELSNIVIRIRELATQSANGVLGPKQRQAIDEEAQELSKEFSRIVQSTKFNGIGLLDGETQEFRFQGGYGSAQTIVSGLGGAMGEGTFGEVQALATEAGKSNALDLGDINGDGILDLVTAGGGAGEATVFIGIGNGEFSEKATLGQPSSVDSVSLADINSDGSLDLITLTYVSPTLSVFLGDGTGNFSQVASYDTGLSTAQGLAVGDVTGDNKVDLIVAGSDNGWSGTAIIYSGLGDGTFFPTSTIADQVFFASAKLGDVDNNGTLDFVGAGLTAEPVGKAVIMLNNGHGEFTKSASITTEATYSMDLSLGDLNGDSILDFVTVGLDAGKNWASVFIGDGNGSFSLAQTLETESDSSMALALGDLNGDGILDLVTAGQSVSGEATVFLGQGDGTFAQVQTLSTEGVRTTALSLGDIDGDGVIDLVTAGYRGGGGEATVFLSNTKNGTSPILPFDLTSKAGALQAMGMLDRKLSSLSTQQGIIGAFEAQLQVELGNLDSARENYVAARSRITDADVAEEAARLARLQILQSASVSVLSQANLQPQIAIQLINGAS